MDEGLKNFIEDVAGEGRFRVEDDLGGGFVRLRVSEAERRQAKHDIRSTEDIVIELLRNARDAGARTVFLALSKTGNMRSITVVDDGSGIPERMQELVFEARVTSKLDSMRMDRWGVHGRGMALFSIRENVVSASVLASGSGKGTSIGVLSNLGALPEKTDQSSMPHLALDADGTLSVRGVRNINRTIVEFVLAEQDACTVYAGTPVEVAATMYWFGMATTNASMRAFASDPGELPVVKRLCLAGDPAEFRELAARLGLSMSERSARRVMDGEIAALPPVVETLVFEQDGDGAASERKATSRDPLKDARGLRIDHADLQSFSEKLEIAWKDLAEAYYLSADVKPTIVVRKDGVHVSFPVRKLM